MKGVLLNAVEEAVSREWGEGMWDDLLTDCGLEGAYTALGNYSDAELSALAHAAADRLDSSGPGRAAAPRTAHLRTADDSLYRFSDDTDVDP